MLDAMAKRGCAMWDGHPVIVFAHVESTSFFNFEAGSHPTQAGSYCGISETVLNFLTVPSHVLGLQA